MATPRSADARTATASQPRTASNWPAILAGFCATLVGLGLARFAYTPLLPAIIDAHCSTPRPPPT